MTPRPETSPTSEPSSAREQVGRGRYVVVGSLGAGSQGETLEAVDKREGRPVAIKRFTIRGAKSWKDVELAEREAAVLASLRHPALPRYIEHFEEDGALYLVMDKVDGESLAARAKRGARLDHAQVVRFLTDTAECLRYLHGHAPPIVHRDIKPGNVILRPDGSYCLVDFGSVRDRLKPEGGSTVVGTFGYMAPEQFQGRAAPVSDVYAVGATALSLLTGREPEDLPHKGLSIDVEAALRGTAERRLIAALRSMLEPDPDRRAGSVAEALESSGLARAVGAGASSVAEAAKQARRARIEAEAARSQAQHEREVAEAERRGAFAAGSRASRKAAKQAEKAARKAARRAQRYARRHAHDHFRRPGRAVTPAIVLGLVILVALAVARVATFALFQVFLPTLFTLLTIVAGRGMLERAERMRGVGRAGQRGLARAQSHIRQQFLGGRAPAPLDHVVDTTAEPAPRRARVSDALEADLEAELESELEAAAEARERREGRR